MKRPIELVDLPLYCCECDEFIIHRICDAFANEHDQNDDYDHYLKMYDQKFKSMDIGYCYHCNP